MAAAAILQEKFESMDWQIKMAKSLNYDHATGKTTSRDLTVDEIAEFEFIATQAQLKQDEIAAKELMKQATLAKLGLTANEAAALLS